MSRLAVVEENGMSVKKIGTGGGAANVEKGNLARDELATRISKNKNVAAVQTEVPIPTPGGIRKYDIEVSLKDGRKVYLEVKAGTGRTNLMQAAKDAYLLAQGFIITTVRMPWL